MQENDLVAAFSGEEQGENHRETFRTLLLLWTGICALELLKKCKSAVIPEEEPEKGSKNHTGQ